MTTYYVRADGTQTDWSKAVGPVTQPDPIGGEGGCMTWATFQTAMAADAFSAFDIISVSSRGGIFTGSANIAVSVDDISIIGETGHRPIVNQNGSNVRFKVTNCSRSLIENIETYGGIANGVEWTETGTGHVIREVHSHDHTGSGVAAFSNELTDAGATVTGYGLVGNNCTDDGWSAHDVSITTIYGGNFYGNGQGINHVLTSVLNLYDVKSFGNTDFDYGATGVGLDSTINAYDCEFGGGVIGAIEAGTTATGNFYRTKFHCNAVSTIAGFTSACVHFAKADTRNSHVYMEGCELLEPPAGKHCYLQYGATATFTGYNNSVTQINEVGNGFFFASNAVTWSMTDSNFYNCLIGISGASGGTMTTCNFDACTTDTSGTIAYTTSAAVDETNLVSGFEQAAIGDFRLASGSALIDAGAGTTVTHDVENRPYSTNDIGCYADTTSRPRVKGLRPS